MIVSIKYDGSTLSHQKWIVADDEFGTIFLYSEYRCFYIELIKIYKVHGLNNDDIALNIFRQFASKATKSDPITDADFYDFLDLPGISELQQELVKLYDTYILLS